MLPFNELIIRVIIVMMLVILTLTIVVPALIALGILFIVVLAYGFIVILVGMFTGLLELCWEVSKDVYNTVTGRW